MRLLGQLVNTHITTNDGLAPPARPTNLSTVTSATRGDDVCPTGFYAAVWSSRSQ
jgi:hypothetical protein